MADNENVHEFEVHFETEGRSVGKMRNEITVDWVNGNEGPWEFATDEGGFHGGENTAPPPIAFWSTGFTACLMTQLRAFARRMKIDLKDCTVRSKFSWKGVQVGRNPYETAPTGFSFDIEIDADASDEEIIALVEAAKKGCFIDQTMAVANNVGHRLKLGDKWVEV